MYNMSTKWVEKLRSDCNVLLHTPRDCGAMWVLRAVPLLDYKGVSQLLCGLFFFF